MSNEVILLTLIAGVLAGAIAARLNREPPWKGAVTMIAAFIVSYVAVIAFAVQGYWWSIALQMLGAGIAGGALKLKSNAIVAIFLLATLAQFAAAFLAGVFAIG